MSLVVSANPKTTPTATSRQRLTQGVAGLVSTPRSSSQAPRVHIVAGVSSMTRLSLRRTNGSNASTAAPPRAIGSGTTLRSSRNPSTTVTAPKIAVSQRSA